ncbi:hypothetical protein EVAR_98230_1 [Eumeta japonica]|uniref:Uncharacterized protein n=1 Tax=Eumeta variegata TaxID=151549 RepID=A0A4C1Y0X1_EUMVA|nr:hypothetical protein EVAR_98230_1 [Eumeta japonica]
MRRKNPRNRQLETVYLPQSDLIEEVSSRVGCVRPLSLFYSDASADGVEEIARSALSLARSAQAERDNESCFFTNCGKSVPPLCRCPAEWAVSFARLRREKLGNVFIGLPLHNSAPSFATAYTRFNKFKGGRANLIDDLCKGSSSMATTEDNISAARLMIETDKPTSGFKQA